MAKPRKKPNGTITPAQPEKFGITLVSCQVIHFNFSIPAEDPSARNLTFHMSLDPTDSPDPSIALFVLTIDGLLEDKEPDIPVVEAFTMKTLTVFRFAGLDSIEKDAEGKSTIPAWGNATILSIVIGTARGILMEKLASTMYSEILLPIVGMKSILTDGSLDTIGHGI